MLAEAKVLESRSSGRGPGSRRRRSRCDDAGGGGGSTVAAAGISFVVDLGEEMRAEAD